MVFIGRTDIFFLVLVSQVWTLICFGVGIQDVNPRFMETEWCIYPGYSDNDVYA